MFNRGVEQTTGMVPNPEQDDDPRNLRYEDMAPFGGITIPSSGDIERHNWTLNQGSSSSCTCHSTVYAINETEDKELSARYAWKKIKTDSKYPSSRLGYGAYMIDSLKLKVNEGICPYGDLPNDANPTESSYRSVIILDELEEKALRFKGGSYVYVTSGDKSNEQRFEDIIRYMHEQQRPVKVGVDWRTSFNNARRTGIVPASAPSGNISGHDMLAVAWKLINGYPYIGFRNSFGASWGDKGRVWLPKKYAKLYSGVAYIPPVLDSIPHPTPIETPRDKHLEKSRAEALRATIEEKFPLNVSEKDRLFNLKARGIAGTEWLVLVPGVVYRGWTFTDVVNYLYARSRNKVNTKAYNLNFNKNK